MASLRLWSFAALLAAAVAASTPSDFIPYRFQTGEMYTKAVTRQAARGGIHLGAEVPFRNTTDNYFSQWIDHANHARGTFQQLFFVDYSYWNGTGPAALYISGESAATGSPNGMTVEYGKAVGALLFTLEHRWYGKSNLSANYSDMSLLDTLTISNALADLVGFMDFVDATLVRQKLKWFSVGGSYAGALSAWLKTTYPNRIAAAWSSSGVVNPKFDYHEYEGHVVSVLPPLCANTIKMAILLIEARWDDEAEFAELQAMFGVSNQTQSEFAYMLGDVYSGPVQYGNKAAMCDMLVPMGRDPLAQFVAMNNKINGVGFGARFVEGRSGITAKATAVRAGEDSSAAASDMTMWLWNYQCCAQMAFWQIGYPDIGTSGNECLRPTSLDTDGFMAVCARDYGPQYFPDVYALHAQLGGAFPNATNVIAFQASDDPFAPAGVNQQVNADYPYVLAQCDGCGHCVDLHAPLPTDPASLVQQRQTIVQYMNKWLGYAYNITFVLQSPPSALTASPTAATETIQQAVLAAMPGQSWVSAMVYACDSSECFSTFTNPTSAQLAIKLAKQGAIKGVNDAFVSVPNGGKGSSGLSRPVVIGIVIGCVAGFFVTLGIIAVAMRRRRGGSRDSGYHAVNDALR